MTNPFAEISLKDAKEIDAEAEIGDEVEIFIPFEEFGRNAIASAKQILIQKVREAERETVYNEYIKKVGDLVTGTVQQVDKGNIIINLGRAEAILPLKEQISKEKYRQGDRIRALVLECQKSQRGPQVVLSRASNALLAAACSNSKCPRSSSASSRSEPSPANPASAPKSRSCQRMSASIRSALVSVSKASACRRLCES